MISLSVVNQPNPPSSWPSVTLAKVGWPRFETRGHGMVRSRAREAWNNGWGVQMSCQFHTSSYTWGVCSPSLYSGFDLQVSRCAQVPSPSYNTRCHTVVKPSPLAGLITTGFIPLRNFTPRTEYGYVMHHVSHKLWERPEDCWPRGYRSGAASHVRAGPRRGWVCSAPVASRGCNLAGNGSAENRFTERTCHIQQCHHNVEKGR